MERLREKKPIPGSLEAILVEAVKAQQRVETSPVSQRLVFERVLARALEQRSVRRFHGRVLLKSLVAGGLLSVAGATVASSLSRGTHVEASAAELPNVDRDAYPPPVHHVHGRKVMNVSPGIERIKY